jgi:hypothetical protein
LHWRGREGSVRGCGVTSRDGSLGLAIGDLANKGGGRGLGLTITDLSDERRRRLSGRGLGLALGQVVSGKLGSDRSGTHTIADLRDDGTGCGSLGLTVADLRDHGARSRSLGLTIRYLTDDRLAGRGLGLTIRDLGDGHLG